MSILKEGLNLSRIDGPNDGDGAHLCFSMETSRIESIVVSMEYGQMAMVPWAVVAHKNGDIIMVNLAEMVTVYPLNLTGDNPKAKGTS